MEPMLPGLELGAVTGWLAQYGFAMLRIGSFLIASPGFGGRFVPVQVRLMAVVVMALPVMAGGIAGGVALPAPEAMAGLGALRILFTEITLGLVAGMVLTILFGAAALAGDRIAATAGLGFAAQFDPAAGGQTPVVAQLFGLFMLMLFLGADGHLAAIRIVLESYQSVPPGAPVDFTRIVATGLTAGSRMFALGMGAMLPVVACLLLLNIAVGIVTRSAPSLNLFSFGFPITMAATLVLLYVTAPVTGSALDDVVTEGIAAVGQMLEGDDGGR
ncbi:flagellar biosynthetic protein FliR [Paragemmobacter straminiformis]|uniref:Flagellar biosynthetic protein FliR n=1 Tax=Paragemmobacter straminiformis TaxID=2045119 RepID=A0A842I581_9RHOB|nr:flagellar biosynthetic protein FliR [Gemmobacter straminiformis]MBC2834769.1 flagellar biosynthetic protein FliR [Gemmobacter straminiformis]